MGPSIPRFLRRSEAQERSFYTWYQQGSLPQSQNLTSSSSHLP